MIVLDRIELRRGARVLLSEASWSRVSGASASGTLSFLSGSVGSTNLWLDRVKPTGSVSANGTDLRVTLLGTGQSVTVDNWFGGNSNLKALSAIVAGLRGSSSGMPCSTLPTKSAPTSAALVKMPPPTRMNIASKAAPKPKPSSTCGAEPL